MNHGQVINLQLPFTLRISMINELTKILPFRSAGYLLGPEGNASKMLSSLRSNVPRLSIHMIRRLRRVPQRNLFFSIRIG